MKKFFKSLPFVTAVAITLGFSSCQNDEIMSNSTEDYEILEATATVRVDVNESRTAFPIEGNDMEFTWTAGDRIVVLSEDGERNIGVMTLSKGEGTGRGEFTGSLRTRKSDTKVNVYYLGLKATEGLSSTMIDREFNISAQETAHKNLTDYGVMHAVTDITRNEETGKVSMNFLVSSLVSYARFYFHLPEGISATNEAVTVSGQNIKNAFTLNYADASLTNQTEGNITITPDWTVGNANEGGAFMVFVPSVDAITEFAVTVGEKTYKAKLDAKEYVAEIFYCGGNRSHGKDIYFSENGEWTVTYMDGEQVVDTQKENSFAPSMTFTAIAGPEKDAFNFLGWAEAENGAVVYTAGQEFTLNRPETEKTLYAVWEAAKAENMTVIAWNNDGTPTKQTAVEYNHTWPYTFDLSNFDTPTRENYKFMGWAASADSKTAITSVTFNYPETVKNVYAIWEETWKESTYTLYYGENGKYGKAQQYYPASGQTPWIFYCEEADYEYTAPAGYELIGWADEEGATVAKYTPGDKITTGGKENLVKTVYPVIKKKTSEGTITAPGSTGTGY